MFFFKFLVSLFILYHEFPWTCAVLVFSTRESKFTSLRKSEAKTGRLLKTFQQQEQQQSFIRAFVCYFNLQFLCKCTMSEI